MLYKQDQNVQRKLSCQYNYFILSLETPQKPNPFFIGNSGRQKY